MSLPLNTHRWNLTWTAEVKHWNTDTWQEFPLLEEILLSSIQAATLSLKSGVLSPGATYRFQLNVSDPQIAGTGEGWSRSVQSMHSLRVQRPPQSGACMTTPNTVSTCPVFVVSPSRVSQRGKFSPHPLSFSLNVTLSVCASVSFSADVQGSALSTLFRVQCTGWIGESPPLRYHVLARASNSSSSSVLRLVSDSPSPSMMLLLPTNAHQEETEYDMVVRIQDTLGNTAESSAGQIRVLSSVALPGDDSGESALRNGRESWHPKGRDLRSFIPSIHV